MATDNDSEARAARKRRQHTEYMRLYRRTKMTPEQKLRDNELHRGYYANNPDSKAGAQARVKQWRKQNRDRWLLILRRWQDKNPIKMALYAEKRRARLKDAPGEFLPEDIEDIYRLQRGRCAYCRASLKSGYHVDHIISISCGGTNFRRNIQLTCQPCNLKKFTSDPIDFARKTGRLL